MEQLLHGNCLELMLTLADRSVDLILCDLPYGTTSCKWDAIIPFDLLWAQYRRVLKDRGSVVLTASQPFTSALVMSNPEMFRVEWVWEKNRGSNFATTKYFPMKEHESVLVFGRGPGTFNPIMEDRAPGGKSRVKTPIKASNTGKREAMSGFVDKNDETIRSEMRVPRSIQKFNTEVGLHPTQKPVALFEYFIRTYSNEGDVVLDNCMGSGTTGVACKRSGRSFIGIETDKAYFDTAVNRLASP